MGRLSKTMSAAALIVGMSQSSVVLASSITNFSVQYFAVANQQGQANSGSVTETPDFYNAATAPGPTGLSTNYVTSTLGPNGLPVFNSSYTTASGTVNAPSSASLLGSTKQLNWWDPASSGGNAYVTAAGTGSVSLSSTPTQMFIPGQTGDQNYFAADILTGYFSLATASSVQFSVGADDSAFVYVDGTLVDSIGGLNANNPTNSATAALGAGQHTVQIFYADRETGNGTLSFSEVSGTGLATPTISATVPEPDTLALFGITSIGLLAFARRSRAPHCR